jgi:4-hydroxybenzoate polyprenyltransferase
VSGPPPPAGTVREVGRFLEIQNLGLNLAFAVAFLLLAARGWPSPWTAFLVVVAFVGARNAGHSFNRWADRDLDAKNPRTAQRAIPAGRRSPAWALGWAAGNGAVLLVAAYFLNVLSFVLAPVALALIFGYSYTKRFTTLTTPFLGLVQAITPAAAFIAVQGTLPLPVLAAVGGLLAWGTAFETIHSLGDVDSDRALGLRSIPVRLGVRGSVRLVPLLHAGALVLLAVFGLLVGLRLPYFIALGLIAALVVVADASVAREPTRAKSPFELHFAMAAVFLAGVGLALLVPFGPTLRFG